MMFLSIILVIFLSRLTSEECPIVHLQGDVLGCFIDSEGVQVTNFENTTLPNESSCFVQDPFGVKTFLCNGSSWKFQEEMRGADRVRRKRFLGSIGHFLGSIFKGAACVLTFFSCVWTGRDGPVDNTPPDIRCGQPFIHAVAEPYQTYAEVFYQEPTAHDETDGRLIPVRINGRPSGGLFPEGTSTVTYEAKDNAGHRSSCYIKINVEVIRCPVPTNLENGFFQCHPVTEFLYGGGCTFGCYEGFDLVGTSEMTCQNNGQWSASQPTCKPWRCSELPSISRAGLPSCTNGYYFRSICTYKCKEGFDMPPDVSGSLVCDILKTWRKYGEPKCVDVEPPTFETCPSLIIGGTDDGENSTEISWDEPKVKDNSGSARVFMKKGHPIGFRFSVGTHNIQYQAEDEAGNFAFNDCSFNVIVRDIRCPKLYPTPFVNFQCPNGYRSGARCTIYCDPGKTLSGSDDVWCIKSTQGLYADWNWKDGEQATCKRTTKCVPLVPPMKGAIACDNWEGGQYCQIQCQNGTELSSVSLNKLYVCTLQGDWSIPPPEIKSCTEKKSPALTLGATASYFTGNCTDESTQHQIENNFITFINNSLYQSEACPDSIECNSYNVQVFCGAESRRKRSHSSTETINATIKIVFRFPFKINEAGDTMDADPILRLFEHLKQTIIHREPELFGNVPVVLEDFQSSGIKIDCPRGSVKSKQSLSCVECSEGTKYVSNGDSVDCEACPKGFFQNMTAQLSCIRCPDKRTTRNAGAQSSDECQEACKSGSYSMDGLPPCTPCEHGFYQTSYGQTFCKPCPSSKTTMTFGSQSISECNEFDIVMVAGTESVVSLILKDTVLLNDFTLSMWVQKDAIVNNTEDNGTLNIVLQDVFDDPQWTLRNLSRIPEQNSSGLNILIDLPDNHWNHILVQRNACNVSVTMNNNHLQVHSFYEGQCGEMAVKSLLVTAANSSKIQFSQLSLWQGKHRLEPNHKCFSNGFGNVVNWKMFEEAHLAMAFVNLPSHCDDFDNCVSSPCLNGECADALNDFICTCSIGFTGKQCDINVDDCETNICINNGKCVDGISNYTCSCEPHYTGQFCEIEIVDGAWSEWGNWSECDTTCGPGLRKRKRLCNSPTPDNGGLNCLGDELEYVDCNNTECPVCPEISAPGNGSLECLNDTELIKCTITCNQGYDFDIEPLQQYYCGPQTFHVWSFQTNENPERRLPRCIEIQMPEELKMLFSARYKNVYCANDVLQENVREKIDLIVKSIVTNIPCVRNTTCKLEDVTVTDCDKANRRRRSLRQAGFSLKITSRPNEDNKNETLADLEEAFQYINLAAERGQFTIKVLGEMYELDANSTNVSGAVFCEPGSTRVKFYCVPCGKGAYFYTNYCKPCPIGTFQNEEGKTSCHECPPGLTTVGIRSSSQDDCSVHRESDVQTGLNVTGIVVGCVCGFTALIVAVFVYRRYRTGKDNVGDMHRGNVYMLELSSTDKKPSTTDA